MAETFGLRIIACDKVFYDGRCTSLILPAEDGEFAIMAHHEDVVIAVIDGQARFINADGNWQEAFIGTGFVQIIDNRVTLLVQNAERPEDIDLHRAEEAKERAEEQLRQKRSIEEYHHSQASLARAMARMKVKTNFNPKGY